MLVLPYLTISRESSCTCTCTSSSLLCFCLLYGICLCISVMSLLKSLVGLTNQLPFALVWRLTAFDASTTIDDGIIVQYKEGVLMLSNARLFSANEFQRKQTTKWILRVLRIRTHPIQVSSRIREGVFFSSNRELLSWRNRRGSASNQPLTAENSS